MWLIRAFLALYGIGPGETWGQCSLEYRRPCSEPEAAAKAKLNDVHNPDPELLMGDDGPLQERRNE